MASDGPAQGRRERRLDQPVWWGRADQKTRSTRATSDAAQAAVPADDEDGDDFAVLYPTAALRIPFIADEETR